jgi:YVTN family beta-propeller protein
MRSLNAPVRCLLLLFACLQVSQAKINYAYVADNLGNNVTVINTSNNTVVTTIPVGTFPYGVAVNQAGTLAYVANSASNSVSVISTTSNTVVATIPVQSGPMNLALSPNGKVLYVSNSNSNSVSVINTGTRTVTTNIAVQNPIGLAVTPTGGFLYAISSGASKVLVISTLTNKVVASVSVGSIPVSIAISPDGSTAYAVNYSSNTVSVIRTADNTVTKTINVSIGPFGEAISPDGRWLYVANYNAGGGNIVSIIDTSTQAVVSTPVVGTGPEQVGFTQDSRFAYVTNITSNNVTLINTASKTVVTTITVGSAPIGIGVMGTMKVTTVAGGYVGDGGAATSAALGGPYAITYDNSGNLYISDFYLNRIRKVSTTGTITTYAGTGICGYNGDNISAKTAMVCVPNGLLVDASGNLIVADGGNSRIRKISTTGKITTIAGNGVFGYSGDGGPALSASIGQPFKMTYDSAGNLYFAQVGNCVIRKVATTGTISTVAGNGTCGFGGDNGSATAAQLNLPRGVAFDSSGNLYISDTNNHRIRKVTPAGIITTFAGTGGLGCAGDGGPALSAAVGNPHGLKVRNNVLYIANGGCSRVRAVDLTSNTITTYAGSFFGYDGDGHAPTSSEFAGIGDLTFDASGNPVIADSFNGRIRKAVAGVVSTIAGGHLGDGSKATSAAFGLAEALFTDKSNNLYIADETGNRIRKVSAGIMSTVAGNGVSGYSGDGGLSTSATLNQPQGVAVDSLGNVFIADTFNNVIRKVDTTGTITTFASNANFSFLLQMGVDGSNNLYVADNGACVVWKITPAGAVSIAAGVLFTCGYNGDGIAATTAQLNAPYGVTVDSHGNLLIADIGNSRVREVTTSGMISTVAGNGTCGYTGDGGSATSAELCPNSVAVTGSGIIYVADFSFGRIRKISNGTITTLAGAGFGFDGDGLWPLYTMFDDPVAVAVDSKGGVYELDDWDHRVRKIQ